MGRPWERPYAERFAGRKPRICLGFVAFGDIDATVFESVVAWAIQQGVRYKDKFELYVTVATRREQYRARNALVMEAQKIDADFIVFIDDDHTLMDCPDMLERFYNAEKPFQGGLYVQRRTDEVQPVIQSYNQESGLCYWTPWAELPQVSGPVDILGGGLNWIDMTIFDFMGEPFWWPYPEDERKVWFKPHPMFGLDMHFCVKVKELLGVQPWLNLDVKVGHASHEREIVRPPGMMAHQLCDHCDGVKVWSGSDGTWVCQTCEHRGNA